MLYRTSDEWMVRVREFIDEVVEVATEVLLHHGIAPPDASPVRFCEVAMGLCRAPLVDSIAQSGPRYTYKASALGEFDPDVGDMPPEVPRFITARATMRFDTERGWSVDASDTGDSAPQPNTAANDSNHS